MTASASTNGMCPRASLAPLSHPYLSDPYGHFEEHRQTRPIFFDDDLDSYVITRHADIDTVFRDAETFSAANAQDPVFPLHPEAAVLLAGAGFRRIRTMTNLDGPEHTRIRKHNQVGFSPRRLRQLEPVIRTTTSALLDQMHTLDGASRKSDLVERLSFPLPATIIFALLGFPPEDTEMLKVWCGDRMSFSWGRPSAAVQTTIAKDMLAYWSYCEAHVEKRLRQSADDFTSDLLAVHRADPDALSTAEVAHVVYGLSFAGHETTTNLISNTVRRVLEAGLWPRLGVDTSRIPAAVDEALRFDSSVISWRRVTTTATTLGGVNLEEGAKLVLLLGSANHDEAVFTQPDTFDLDRPNVARHFSFGFGKHYCLGATLAKLEVGVVLEEMTQRFPELRLVEDQAFEFHENITFRGPRRLLVSW
jgi:cytochrome P450